MFAGNTKTPMGEFLIGLSNLIVVGSHIFNLQEPK